jgi:hypothetical protein
MESLRKEVLKYPVSFVDVAVHSERLLPEEGGVSHP